MNGILDVTRLAGAAPGLQESRWERTNAASAADHGTERLESVSERGRTAPATDEYVPGEAPVPTGLYRITRDEDGTRRILFDDPEKENGREEAEPCTGNTDPVDREIRKLQQKRAELEQKIARGKNDPDEQAKLEKQLAQVENELRIKDTDSYRRQHCQFT